MDKKSLEKLIKHKLKKEGVNEQWMEKHLIIDTFEDIFKKREKKNDRL